MVDDGGEAVEAEGVLGRVGRFDEAIGVEDEDVAGGEGRLGGRGIERLADA